MSGARTDHWWRSVRAWPCPYCLAPAGDPCRTRRGAVLEGGHEHLPRLKMWARTVARMEVVEQP